MVDGNIDRMSFILGYLIARGDCAATVLDLVADAEQMVERMEEIEADEPDRSEPIEAPHGASAPNQSKLTLGEKALVLTRLGHGPAAIARALGAKPSVVNSTLLYARRKGVLPAAKSAAAKAIKAKTPGPIAEDVTAMLMGDPPAREPQE